MSVVDGAVSKYLETQQRIGAVFLQEANQEHLAQQQRMVEMQRSLGGYTHEAAPRHKAKRLL